MSADRQPRIVEQTLPSRLDAYQGFLQSLLEELESLGWPAEELLGVHLALEESISNAIRHGNQEDPDKQVEVKCRLEPHRFWAEVCDEGEGFCPSDVPDCCDADRLALPGGRGLALMRAYMTHVEYNCQGNCVTFEKRRPADASGR